MLSVLRSQASRRQWTAVAVSIALVSTACSADPVLDDGAAETESTADETQPSGGSEFKQTALDCVTDNYPCSWSEAEPGVAERTDDILAIAAAFASTGDTAQEIAAAIELAPDVASVVFDELGVMFRVEGGVPVFVDIDPTGSGDLLSGGVQPAPGTALPSLAAGGVFTGCGPAVKVPAGVRGVAKKEGEPKHALLLSPWQFGLPWDIAKLEDNLEQDGSRYSKGYEGSVTVKQTPAAQQSISFPSGSNVVPSDFCGWEKFDTIVLMTHGRALCADYDDEGVPEEFEWKCTTSFAVGQFKESVEQTRALVGGAVGVTVAVTRYQGWTPTLTEEQKDACIVALERRELREGSTSGCFVRLPVPRVTVKVTTNFFKENYPQGLPDRLIFLAACQGMKFGDMARTLGITGGNGRILGFTQIALLEHAQYLLDFFTRLLGSRNRVGDEYTGVANKYLDVESAKADLEEHPLSDLLGGELGDLETGGPATWGSDPVSIASAGVELVDGAEVAVAPSAGGDGDSLLITLMLSDVVNGETPDDYDIGLLWNDQPIDAGALKWVPVGDDNYESEVALRLPRSLEDEEAFDLEIRGVLPGADNAPTRWKFTELTAKVATVCDVLRDVDVSGALGVGMTKSEIPDYGQGAFFGDFCGWRDAADSSGITVLVANGGADGFRADWTDSDIEVSGFGDIATYDAETGNANSCSSIEDRETGELQWACFVNLNVAVGDDVLYFTLSGNVVGENGSDVARGLLTDLVRTLRERLDAARS